MYYNFTLNTELLYLSAVDILYSSHQTTFLFFYWISSCSRDAIAFFSARWAAETYRNRHGVFLKQLSTNSFCFSALTLLHVTVLSRATGPGELPVRIFVLKWSQALSFWGRAALTNRARYVQVQQLRLENRGLWRCKRSSVSHPRKTVLMHSLSTSAPNS